MNKIFKQLKKETGRISLTREEKEGSRSLLRAFMESHPIAGTRVPQFHVARHQSIFHLSLMARGVSFALLVALFAGGGVTFGAQAALPGDFLYPVKVNVTEKLERAFQFSLAGKAEIAAKLAARRLDEAEQLAVNGKLDPTAQADIEERFAAHVEEAHARLADLNTEQEFAAAAAVSSKFEATLKAHSGILKQLARADAPGKQGAFFGAMSGVGSIAMQVDLKARATEERRIAGEEQVAQATTPDVKAAAEGTLHLAKKKIEDVRFSLLGEKANADSYAEVATQLQTAEEAIDAGKRRLAGENPGEAFAFFQKADRIAEEAKLLITARAELNLPFVLGAPAAQADGAYQVGFKAGEVPSAASAQPEPSAPKKATPSEDQTGANRTSLNLPEFRKLRDQAVCGDVSNRFFLITGKLGSQFVFWDVRGNCSDAHYSYTLFDAATNAAICSKRETIAGPFRECATEAAEGFFEIIIQNLAAKDLGLGSSYHIESFEP